MFAAIGIRTSNTRAPKIGESGNRLDHQSPTLSDQYVVSAFLFHLDAFRGVGHQDHACLHSWT